MPKRLGGSFTVAFSADGRWLATSTRRAVKIRASADFSARVTVRVPNPSEIRFAPTGEGFLVKTTSGRLSWHTIDGRESRMIRGDVGEGTGLEFIGNARVVNTGWDGSVEVIDLESTRALMSRSYAGEMLKAVHHDPCGRRWFLHHCPKWNDATSSRDPDYFSIWSAEEPFRRVGRVAHGFDRIGASALHPLGRILAVVHGVPPGSLSLVEADAKTIHRSRAIESRGGTGSDVAWSPDGRLLAVIEDHTTERHAARVYDDQLRLVREFPLAFASSVAFAPDGRSLVIGSWQDGGVVQLA